MQPFELLTKREKEVAELLLQGKSNKQIALALGISERTVEFHLKSVYNKLQVNSRIAAVLKLGESTGSFISVKPVESTVAGNGEDAENGDGSNSRMNWPVSLRDIFSHTGKELTVKNVLLYIALIAGALLIGTLFIFTGTLKATLETATPFPEKTETQTSAPALPQAEIPVVLTPTSQQPELIEVGFLTSYSLIPASLDPATQSQEVANQYEAIRENESEAWAGASFEDSGFSLNINSLSQGKRITLKYPVHVSITLKNAAIHDLNIATPMGGGGGDPVKEFPRFSLEPGEFDLMPDDPSPIDLVFPDTPAFPYVIKISCQQAGMFDLAFTIPYDVIDASGVQERAKLYTVSIVCPQSAALWGLIHELNGTTSVEKVNQLVFENGSYIQQP